MWQLKQLIGLETKQAIEEPIEIFNVSLTEKTHFGKLGKEIMGKVASEKHFTTF